MKLILISIGRYRPALFIPKWVQSAQALRSNDVIKTCRTWKLRFFAKIQNFAIKVPNIRISPGFLIIQKESGNYNMFGKFQHHSMQIFFFSKWRIKMSRNWKRLHPPLTLWLWRLTLPRVRWYAHFFSMKMTAKDVKEITYNALGNFL